MDFLEYSDLSEVSYGDLDNFNWISFLHNLIMQREELFNLSLNSQEHLDTNC